MSIKLRQFKDLKNVFFFLLDLSTIACKVQCPSCQFFYFTERSIFSAFSQNYGVKRNYNWLALSLILSSISIKADMSSEYTNICMQLNSKQQVKHLQRDISKTKVDGLYVKMFQADKQLLVLDSLTFTQKGDMLGLKFEHLLVQRCGELITMEWTIQVRIYGLVEANAQIRKQNMNPFDLLSLCLIDLMRDEPTKVQDYIEWHQCSLAEQQRYEVYFVWQISTKIYRIMQKQRKSINYQGISLQQKERVLEIIPFISNPQHLKQSLNTEYIIHNLINPNSPHSIQRTQLLIYAQVGNLLKVQFNREKKEVQQQILHIVDEIGYIFVWNFGENRVLKRRKPQYRKG